MAESSFGVRDLPAGEIVWMRLRPIAKNKGQRLMSYRFRDATTGKSSRTFKHGEWVKVRRDIAEKLLHKRTPVADAESPWLFDFADEDGMATHLDAELRKRDPMFEALVQTHGRTEAIRRWRGLRGGNGGDMTAADLTHASEQAEVARTLQQEVVEAQNARINALEQSVTKLVDVVTRALGQAQKATTLSKRSKSKSKKPRSEKVASVAVAEAEAGV